jgi:predicted transcriptional regulator
MSKTVSIRLEDNVISDLDKLSNITERSKAWLMGKAVEQYIENESWQIEAIEKTLKKVKSGNAKFANHDSVTQWLESWGTENEQKPPKCK